MAIGTPPSYPEIPGDLWDKMTHLYRRSEDLGIKNIYPINQESDRQKHILAILHHPDLVYAKAGLGDMYRSAMGFFTKHK